MIVNGLVLAILSTTAWCVIFQKLPRRIRKLIQKHTLLADVVALLLTYMVFGGTLTALVAAAMVGLFISMLLHIVNHPEQFLYINDFIEIIKKKLTELKKVLDELGTSYREKKEKEIKEEVTEAA